ncbi:MAG: hypothetical protein NTY46_13675, partial [Candidatus Sumerlaeota bacterium]|nr:hypothetical protein [Candidatus Sumerlaeota bacterium]
PLNTTTTVDFFQLHSILYFLAVLATLREKKSHIKDNLIAPHHPPPRKSAPRIKWSCSADFLKTHTENTGVATANYPQL